MTNGDLETAEEGDLRPWVVFTQLRVGGPFEYAGWLDAADAAMAVDFAREHYGQDQRCVAIWTIDRDHLASSRGEFPIPRDEGPERPFQVFRQVQSGGAWESLDTVGAPSSAAALGLARQRPGAAGWKSIWVADAARIVTTGPDELIWRHCDQSYRLARGYSKSVRAKWEKVRAERDIDEYEREDLQESF